MAHIRHPLIGDPVYGGRLRLPKGCSEALAEALRAFPRQALHAAELHLIHPRSGESMGFVAALPDDYDELLEVLEDDMMELQGGAGNEAAETFWVDEDGEYHEWS